MGTTTDSQKVEEDQFKPDAVEGVASMSGTEVFEEVKLDDEEIDIEMADAGQLGQVIETIYEDFDNAINQLVEVKDRLDVLAMENQELKQELEATKRELAAAKKTGETEYSVDNPKGYTPPEPKQPTSTQPADGTQAAS